MTLWGGRDTSRAHFPARRIFPGCERGTSLFISVLAGGGRAPSAPFGSNCYYD